MFTPSRFAIARWILAVLILYFGVGRNYGYWSVNAFINFAIFVVALILIVPEAVPWLAERLSMPFLEIWFPSLSFPKPPLSYALARHYRDQGRLEEAAEEYRKIIRYYPREEDAYRELLEIAEKMEDRKLGGRYAALYHRRFSQVAPIAAK